MQICTQHQKQDQVVCRPHTDDVKIQAMIRLEVGVGELIEHYVAPAVKVHLSLAEWTFHGGKIILLEK